MRLRISLLAALLALAAAAPSAFPLTTHAATTGRPHLRSASLVRSGGFVYYRRVLATVGAADAPALARLSALLPEQLPPARPAVPCADCRTTRLELVIGGRRFSYVWGTSPPRSLRPLVAALRRHG